MIRSVLIACGLVTGLLLAPQTGSGQQNFGNSTRVRLGGGLPDVPGAFTFCRLAYTSIRSLPSGSGWTTDYPMADRHFTTRLAELTPTWVSRWSHGEPGYTPIQITDTNVNRCPFLMASHVGSLTFRDADVVALRDYLLKGGFLWADDFWGSASWDFFAQEIGKVLPEFPIVELPMDHPLFSIVYTVTRIPQIPAISSWRRLGGGTSELGADSAIPSMSAILDDTGRILVLITHNTDIADGWEREGDNADYFALFSPDAYAIGINVAIWILTH